MEFPDYNPNDPKHLANWFDAQNPRHVRAYRRLQREGQWPAPFWDLMQAEGVVVHASWQLAIVNRLADAWCNHILREE